MTDTRCPVTTVTGGYTSRTRRCERDAGHSGQCSYRNAGGQGGSLVRWWGANPRPLGWIDDLTYSQMVGEIGRLRRLCDEAGVDWLKGLK